MKTELKIILNYYHLTWAMCHMLIVLAFFSSSEQQLKACSYDPGVAKVKVIYLFINHLLFFNRTLFPCVHALSYNLIFFWSSPSGLNVRNRFSDNFIRRCRVQSSNSCSMKTSLKSITSVLKVNSVTRYVVLLSHCTIMYSSDLRIIWYLIFKCQMSVTWTTTKVSSKNLSPVHIGINCFIGYPKWLMWLYECKTQ